MSWAACLPQETRTRPIWAILLSQNSWSLTFFFSKSKDWIMFILDLTFTHWVSCVLFGLGSQLVCSMNLRKKISFQDGIFKINRPCSLLWKPDSKYDYKQTDFKRLKWSNANRTAIMLLFFHNFYFCHNYRNAF